MNELLRAESESFTTGNTRGFQLVRNIKSIITQPPPPDPEVPTSSCVGEVCSFTVRVHEGYPNSCYIFVVPRTPSLPWSVWDVTNNIEIANSDGFRNEAFWIGDGYNDSVEMDLEYEDWLERSYEIRGSLKETYIDYYNSAPMNTPEATVVIHQYSKYIDRYTFYCENTLLTIPDCLPKHIVDTTYMFSGSNLFNQDLSHWDTSRIVDMYGMFRYCENFNQDISNWDVSNVVNMSKMFQGCHTFNQDISRWRVGEVIEMEKMFNSCYLFNQDLSPWCVSKIPTQPYDFDLGASIWTQPRPLWGTCGGVVVEPEPTPPPTDATDNPTLLDFDFAVVRFIWTYESGSDLDIRTYISTPDRMSSMVGWSRQDRDGDYLIWTDDNRADGVEAVLVDMKKIVTDYPDNTQIIIALRAWWYNLVRSGDLNIGFSSYKGGSMVRAGYDWTNAGGVAVQNLLLPCYTMIEESSSAQVGDHLANLIYNPNENKGELVVIPKPPKPEPPEVAIPFIFTIEPIAEGTSAIGTIQVKIYLSNDTWQIYRTINGQRILLASRATLSTPDAQISTDTNSIVITMPINLASIATYEILGHGDLVTIRNTNAGSTDVRFDENILINVIQYSSLIFRYQFGFGSMLLNSVPNLPPTITTTDRMFSGSANFNQDISGWDVSNVTDMELMFANCITFDQPIGNWDTSKVTTMEGMFLGCSVFNQPLDNWNVSNVTDMEGIFRSCVNFNQPLNSWNVSNVTHMWNMFNNTQSFNQPLNNWNVGKVMHLDWMFQGALMFNQDLSMWNVAKFAYPNYPLDFATNTPSWTLPKPVWGTTGR